MYTVAQLKNSISGILSGLPLGNVTDLNGKIERSARTLVQKADIIEASGKQQYNIYDGVFDYVAPTTIFGGCVFDLRPQGVDRNSSEYAYKEYIADFDRTKLTLPNGVELTFEYVNGVGRMRVASARTQARAVLDPMTDTAGWTAAGSASGLAKDATDYYSGGDSLRFTLTGASTGTLTKTVSGGDMSTYKGVGLVFLAMKIPVGATLANLTSLALKIGSSSTSYTTVSGVTQGFLGAWIVGDWLITSFDLSLGVDTSSPDWTKITYVQLSLVTAGTITNMRVGGLWAALPSPYTLLFGSAAIWLPAATGVAQTTISLDTDQVLLNDAAYTLLQWEAAKEIAIGQGGTKASGAVQMIEKRLDVELYPMYRADNPSQEIRTIGNWYDD